MGKHDDRHAAVMAKAGTRHASATGDAARAYDKVADAAGAALAKAQEAYDRTIAEAAATRLAAEQVSRAELARTAKQAMSDWTAAEREDQAVPSEAFVRRDFAGKYSIHAGPGIPAAATGWQNGNNEWVVESEAGRAFVGGTELTMRRELFKALMRPHVEFTAGEPA